MFEIHSQTIARLQRQVTELEEERVRLQGYQCDIVGKEVEKRVKELKPKPLTDAEIWQLAEHVGLLGSKSRVGNSHDATEKLVKAVERYHGIGEKE
jgi:hypothetical protein